MNTDNPNPPIDETQRSLSMPTILQDRRKLPRTEQGILNHVVAHLEAQGWERAVDQDHGCRYRTEDGKACAVGCFLPDNIKTAVSLENISSTVAGLLSNCHLSNEPALRSFVEKHGIFLRELQYAHDNEDAPDMMRERIRDCAIGRGLKLPAALREAA